jgi:hypothetical protein
MSESWVNARRAKEEKLFDTGPSRRFDYVGLNRKIVVNKFRRKARVSGNAADRSSREKDGLRAVLGKPMDDGRLAPQVQLIATGRLQNDPIPKPTAER